MGAAYRGARADDPLTEVTRTYSSELLELAQRALVLALYVSLPLLGATANEAAESGLMPQAADLRDEDALRHVPASGDGDATVAVAPRILAAGGRC